MESTMKPTSDWRSVIKVHPAADLFPMMGQDELRALGEDIKANGIKTAIGTWFDKDEQEWLIDGRNRLDALAALGYQFGRGYIKEGYSNSSKTQFRIYKPDSRELGVYTAQHRECETCGTSTMRVTDPYTVAVSYNINRRHLTGEQKSELIAALLKADPAKSDRAIAATAKVSDKTVGKTRAAMEATADIPRLKARTGADGKTRKQPTKSEETAAKLQPLSEPLVGMVEELEEKETKSVDPLGALVAAWEAAPVDVRKQFLVLVHRQDDNFFHATCKIANAEVKAEIEALRSNGVTR